MKNLILVCLTIVLGISACKSKAGMVKENTTTSKEESQPNINLNDIWALQTLDGSDYNMKEVKKGVKIPTLEFHLKDMRYAGNDGCNSIFGALDKVTASELQFGTGGATRMFCVDDEVSPIFNKSLGLVRSYKIEKTTLHLIDADGKTLMTFRKVD